METLQSNFPLEIAIRETSGDVPASAILGSTTLALGESATLSKLITFPQTINVVSGTQYAIVVRYVDAPVDGAHEGKWFGAITASSTYAGGHGGAFQVDGRGWFSTNSDKNFRTYIVGDLQADAGQNQAVCFGASVSIGGSTTASGGSGSYTYSWSPSTGLNVNNVANPIASPAVTTTYTVTITEGNCTATDQVTVTVNEPPSLFFDAAGPFFLSDPAFDLANVVGPSGGSFSGPGVSGTMFDPAAAGVGTHTIVYSYTDGNSCSNSASQNVTVNENPAPQQDFVVLATNSVWLELGADILSGDVIVNNAGGAPTLTGKKLIVGIGATTAAGYVLKADDIQVLHGARVNSDVFYNKLVNRGTIKGSLNTPLNLPVFAQLPDFVTAPAGSQNITVAKNGSLSLPPGNYRDIKVQKKGVLRLQGGIYNIRYLELG